MNKPSPGRRSAFAAYTDSRAIILFFLGISAGMPILLIFSSLSLWLREAGVARETVTMFSWAALAYSFKFVWAPLVNSLPLPLLGRLLGRRRSWLLLAQAGVVSAAAAMALVNPVDPQALRLMAAAAVLLGFSSATQDIVIDAYRIEAAAGDAAMQSVMSATYSAGYRVGMVLSGAGALFLAAKLGSAADHYSYEAWRQTYLAMAALMAAGVLTTLLMREPQAAAASAAPCPPLDHLRLVLLFLGAVSAFVAAFVWVGSLLPEGGGALAKLGWETLRLASALAAAGAAGALLVAAKVAPAALAVQTWVSPVTDFFRRYGRSALLLLALIGLYRISDIVAGVISNVFYQDLGFSKEEIAWAVKTFGVLMAIAGGFVGGALSQRYSLMKMMMLGAVLAAATNLLFVALAYQGRDLTLMYLAVGSDNLASGLAGAVFVAFLSVLTNIRFTAVQYAILSSLMTLLPKTLGGYSGTMVENIGYPGFFLFTALLGLPVLLLVYLVDKKIYRNNQAV